MNHLHRALFTALTTLASAALLHCGAANLDELGDGEELAVPAGDEAYSKMSNPAAFDLRCLWAGEKYASRAPNAVAASAIRFACDIQAAQVPYRVPGANPWRNQAPSPSEGVDCSGLTANVYFRATGGQLRLPHSAASQEKMLPAVGLWSMLPGDLIYYESSSALSGRHTAMYLGDGLMIEAWGKNAGVVINAVRGEKLTSIRRPQ